MYDVTSLVIAHAILLIFYKVHYIVDIQIVIDISINENRISHGPANSCI